jgi:signal transduction histidine kinase
MLSEIVGDLLILAVGRAELSTLKPEPVDLKDLLKKTMRFFETQAKEKRIQLQPNYHVRDGIVSGNREGLASVITNLLSNAIKYTPEDGRVTVSLFESKEHVVVEISDSGIGIPKDEQAELFREFYRASNAKEIARIGTGLGLSIVKATVEQHGGSIDFTSQEGKGTTFRIFLNRTHRKAPAQG